MAFGDYGMQVAATGAYDAVTVVAFMIMPEIAVLLSRAS
jgi:hypothetical protein